MNASGCIVGTGSWLGLERGVLLRQQFIWLQTLILLVAAQLPMSHCHPHPAKSGCRPEVEFT